jgi:ribonuclease-3
VLIDAEQREALEAKLGYSFRNVELLERALTHRSFTKDKSAVGEQTARRGGASNELLEYLGDSVLGLVASEHLIQAHPEAGEGELSKRRSRLVSEVHLHRAAQRLGLGEHLLLGRGEERAGGREKKALLADAVEALIAAVYLDGGLEKARAAVGRWVLDAVDGEDLLATDYKTALQELLQERKLAAPRYQVIKESGPEHRKIFTVRALVEGRAPAEAEGASKKAAEQAAARIALERLRDRSSMSGKD